MQMHSRPPRAVHPAGELLGVLERLEACSWRVISTGHHDDDLGLRLSDGIPGQRDRMLSRQTQDVLTPGELDQLGCPMAGHEDRIEPLERGDARPAPAADGELHAIDASRDLADQIDPALATVRRLRHGAYIAQSLAEGRGSSEMTFGFEGSLAASLTTSS